MAATRADFGIIDVNNTSSGVSAATVSSVGDVLYVVIADNNAAATVTDSKSNTWTQIGTDLTAGVVVGQRWYAVVASGKSGSGHTITVTFTGTANSTPIWRRISGASASPLDSSASTQGVNASLASGTLAQANNIVFSDAFCDGAAGGYTAGGGFTKFQEQTNDSLYWTQAAADQTTSATTAVTASWSVSGNAGAGLAQFVTVFQEAASGGAAALTGQSSTASAGTAKSAISLTLTGASITSAAGTLTSSSGVSRSLSGSAATFAPGSLAPAIAEPITGIAVTASQGSLTGITATAGFVKRPGPGVNPFNNGQFVAAPRGLSSSISSSGAITGLSVTTGQGNLTEGIAYALTGQSAAISTGTLTNAVSTALSGQSTTLSGGNITETIAGALTGASITASQGNVNAGNDTFQGLSGQAVTLSLGSVASSLTKSLSGSSSSVSLGTATNVATYSISGNLASVSQGALLAGADRLAALSGSAISFSQGVVTPSISATGPIVNSTQAIRLNGPSIMILSPGESRTYRVYADDLASGVDIASGEITANGLTFGSVSVDNTTTPKSAVISLESGGQHGRTYQASVTLGLTSGGPLVGTVSIRFFNG